MKLKGIQEIEVTFVSGNTFKLQPEFGEVEVKPHTEIDEHEFETIRQLSTMVQESLEPQRDVDIAELEYKVGDAFLVPLKFLMVDSKELAKNYKATYLCLHVYPNGSAMMTHPKHGTTIFSKQQIKNFTKLNI